MRITRLRVRDIRRYRDLDVTLAPGLTVVRGPNEAGKSTLQRILELALGLCKAHQCGTVGKGHSLSEARAHQLTKQDFAIRHAPQRKLCRKISISTP